MSFDAGRYEREVVRPMRGRSGPLTDDDLLRRYAIGPGLTDPAELAAHLRRLRTYWNQTASGPDSRAQVCRRLLAADEDLQRRPGVDLASPAWWRQYAQRRDADARQTTAQLAADLRTAYEAVGQVTREQLAGIAGQHPGLDAEQVSRAVRAAGLRVADAIELPAASGLDRAAYRELGARLREAGVFTVVHLLHPDLNRPFALVERFSVDSQPGRRLDRATLEERIAEADRSADSPAMRARRAALRVLQTGLRAGADLRTVALFQIVEQLQAGRSHAIADALLIRQATRIGLTQSDAELVVASLPSGAANGTAGAAAIRDLLAGGRLRAAQAALASLPATDPERSGIAAEIARLENELSGLLGAAERALRERREEEAERLIGQARRIAEDDEDVRTRAGRLPLPPPRELRPVAAGHRIRLDWQEPHSAAPGIRYRVLRRTGATPAGPQDGTLVAQTEATAATDEQPPVASEVYYAVFATADPGTVWSRAATAQVTLVPPVTQIAVRGAADRISVTWQAHPATVEVRVRRTEGRPPRDPADGEPVAAGPGTLVDRRVTEGIEYFYGLVAVYHDERHDEVAAHMVVVSASPQPEAQPLDGLRIEPVHRRGGGMRVRLSWPATAGTVRIRYAPEPPPWAYGTVVAPADAARYGREVAGVPERRGPDLVLETDVPAGPHLYVPFSLGSSGAVVGRAVPAGQAEPVQRVHARRTGDLVTVTWVWPPGTGLAEVRWTPRDAAAEVLRVTRSAYVDGEGCVLRAGPAGGTVSLRAVTVGPAGEARSDPVEATVPARALRLRYTLRRPPGWRDRRSGRRILEITADQDCAGVDLAVVVAPGQVKPLAARPEQVAAAFHDVTLARDQPLALDFAVPRTARPYWIRCFVTRPAGVSVVDPPVAELKVS
jgi:hypothetical protein